MNHIYIGDRQLDQDDEPDDIDIECPCGSHIYTTHGSCMHCGYELEDCMPDMSDPGEPNEDPE